MKAPITPAQAWAVIAESAGWNAKELPVLPALYEALRQGYWQQESEDFFVCLTKNDSLAMADKLEPLFQAYGQQCAAHAREVALEEAAIEIERVEDSPNPIINITNRLAAAAVRQLKGK